MLVSDSVRGHLHIALEGSYGENISMWDWTNTILNVGADHGCWERSEMVQCEDRYRPGDSDVEGLRVGYEKLHEKTGWEPEVSWEESIFRTIDWYANNRESWYGRADWR